LPASYLPPVRLQRGWTSPAHAARSSPPPRRRRRRQTARRVSAAGWCPDELLVLVEGGTSALPLWSLSVRQLASRPPTVSRQASLRRWTTSLSPVRLQRLQDPPPNAAPACPPAVSSRRHAEIVQDWRSRHQRSVYAVAEVNHQITTLLLFWTVAKAS